MPIIGANGGGSWETACMLGTEESTTLHSVEDFEVATRADCSVFSDLCASSKDFRDLAIDYFSESAFWGPELEYHYGGACKKLGIE